MAWFHPAPDRLNSLLSQGLGTPNTPAYLERLAKILKLIQRPGLLHPPSVPTWLSMTRTHDLSEMIRTLPPQALLSPHQQTLLHECPQNEQDFERWWIAFHGFSPSLRSALDNTGRNALHFCLTFEASHPKYAKQWAERHLQRIQALVDSGVDLEAVDQNGQTPMEVWIETFLNPTHFHDEAWLVFKPWIRQMLRIHGFKRLMPHFWKEEGFQCLFDHDGQPSPFIMDKAERLFDMGYPATRLQQGTSLLHLAVRHNLPGVAALVLERGGKGKLKDKKGLTPMQLLKRLHPQEVGQNNWTVLEQDFMEERLPLAKSDSGVKRL